MGKKKNQNIDEELTNLAKKKNKMDKSQHQHYSGEQLCQSYKQNRDKCTNKAYFMWDGKLLCGVHSSRKKSDRIKLPKNPKTSLIKQSNLEAHQQKCNRVAKQNKQRGHKGHVMCSKMRMMKDIGLVDGYVNVFPNYKHANRKDGLGLPSLSPMSIGPIQHGQPGLPNALNLQNFHQGNKVYPCEVDEKGSIKQKFYKTQMQMYEDPIPHRHKFTQGAKVKPLYSVWIDRESGMHKVTYFQSRQFYCIFYERGTINNPDFLMLKKMVSEGHNLRICGYDAYDTGLKSIEEWYCDTSSPFGHELVLYTMLSEPAQKWPWNKFKTFQF